MTLLHSSDVTVTMLLAYTKAGLFVRNGAHYILR